MSENILLSRDTFRVQTLNRQKGVCCVPDCELPAVDAHHILNRNLFTDAGEFGGYFYGNGAQLCSGHHYDAELTKIATWDLWKWCEVEPVVPSQFNADLKYDCWGNQIKEDGFRIAGPLFHDDGFQKILKVARISWLFPEQL